MCLFFVVIPGAMYSGDPTTECANPHRFFFVSDYHMVSFLLTLSLLSTPDFSSLFVYVLLSLSFSLCSSPAPYLHCEQPWNLHGLL